MIPINDASILYFSALARMKRMAAFTSFICFEMISFFIGVALLVVGYLVYGSVIERVFGADDRRPTPAVTQADGADFVPLKWHKIFLIQFLNIAGLGPIFGAVMGAVYGPVAFLWIVFGLQFLPLSGC